MWVIHGIVDRPHTGLPRRVHFDEPIIVGMETPSRDYDFQLSPGVGSIALEFDRALMDVSQACLSSHGRSWRLSLRPSNALPIGRFETLVKVIPKESSGNALPSRLLIVSGVVRSNPEAVPSLLQLGAAHIGSTLSATVSFRYHNSIDFGEPRIEMGSQAISLRKLEGGDRGLGALEYEISVRAVSAGSHEDRIVFVFSENGEPDRRVVLPVRYHGIQGIQGAPNEQ